MNELWRGRRLDLLAGDVRDLLPVKKFPMKTEGQCSHGVHVLNALFLMPLLDPAVMNRGEEILRGCLHTATGTQREAFVELATEFEQSGRLARLDEQLLALTQALVERFRFLVPAFGMRFYRDRQAVDLKQFGTTVAGFEDLKQFFVDGFELVVDLLVLSTAWNNVVHRGTWNQMTPRRKDVRTVADFEGKSKGERVQFLDAREMLDELFASARESGIRNAISHNSYRYDGSNQTITFYPRGRIGEGDPQEVFLMEFAEKCLDLFMTAHLGAQLISVTRKVLYWSRGDDIETDV